MKNSLAGSVGAVFQDQQYAGATRESITLPENVVTGMQEKNWLKPVDEVVVEVEGFGKSTNRMAWAMSNLI
jgi:2-keto-4-pentenoate hydratase/2-oxohepta-3-ene-1,7-dioic acid hydratase in catechol pathway